MTASDVALRSAIAHIDDLLRDESLDCDCREEHEQLKAWLTELESLRVRHARLRSETRDFVNTQLAALHRIGSSYTIQAGRGSGKRTLLDDMLSLEAGALEFKMKGFDL